MAEKDRKVTERVEAKKELERYIYGIKAAASNHNVNVNWNELDKANLEMALREASKWLDGYGSDPSSSKEDYEKAMQKLTDVWNPIIRNVYV
ncbi:unnamed protein product [Linum tenue]|uniref:Uncharacterized protein n=1 Tax=Linum tenue TaxID=586396 RepID=A0AAV0JPP1_9ROSI|nr:unnamed protein product [Linum tenue]